METAMKLRAEVERALRATWPVFAAAHPRLAAVVDLGLALDAAVDHFADDADYQHVLADASARGALEEEMAVLVRKLVKQWIGSLI